MTFAEFINKCYTIQYKQGAPITEFGEPMDCYGFVWWYYKFFKNIELERNNVQTFADIKCIKYVKIQIPQTGDVVHLRTNDGNYMYHIGLYIDGNIYHFTAVGLLCKRADRILNKIKGYYRAV